MLCWILFVLTAYFLFLYAGTDFWIYFLIGILCFLIFCFFLWFFRDPERTPDGKYGILSPADGKILPSRKDKKIRIFMGPFDVHVNRAPLSGKIAKQEYKKGKYKPAYSKEADNNEQLKWIFRTKNGKIELTQIAGIIARRIVSYKKTGEIVGRGERIGMIKFGSRVDLRIPQKYKIVVKAGEQVYAGKTIIAI